MKITCRSQHSTTETEIGEERWRWEIKAAVKKKNYKDEEKERGKREKKKGDRET